jgi:4-amino-4-deoxy-L-arabinose transferase-like glycosyltransferase
MGCSTCWRLPEASGGANNSLSVDSALISYLEAHQGSAIYLVAVASSNQADAIILATNRPVMALGGFSGSDPILTTSQLATLVKGGVVKYFLLGAGGPGGGQSSLTGWVTQYCTAVPSSQWQSSTSMPDNTSGSFDANQLYVCSTQ